MCKGRSSHDDPGHCPNSNCIILAPPQTGDALISGSSYLVVLPYSKSQKVYICICILILLKLYQFLFLFSEVFRDGNGVLAHLNRPAVARYILCVAKLFENEGVGIGKLRNGN